MTAGITCPKCQAAGETGLVCSACNAVLPPRHIDCFSALGIAPEFDVDLTTLETRYLALSRLVHPDKFVNEDAKARMHALQAATTLNEATRKLRDPMARAAYLLELFGVGSAEQERGDPDFMMEVLELREELAEAKAAGQRDKLERLKNEMQTRIDTATQDMAQRFSVYQSTQDRACLGQAAGLLGRLRFFNRYLDEAEHSLEEAA